MSNTIHHIVCLLFAAVSCPYPTGVPNGQVRLNTNTEAEYRCYKGYNLIGSNKVWCTDTAGTWTPEVPDCQRELISNNHHDI